MVPKRAPCLYKLLTMGKKQQDIKNVELMKPLNSGDSLKFEDNENEDAPRVAWDSKLQYFFMVISYADAPYTLQSCTSRYLAPLQHVAFILVPNLVFLFGYVEKDWGIWRSNTLTKHTRDMDVLNNAFMNEFPTFKCFIMTN
ncbi:hypothetical protein KUTeg_019841 [Tegillarca granosa]|uniref:Uncharacterized protein n=1 Tax=Tegillarca granosa TaxID=220873 RepID=A0ABQ9EIU8_TEGGR|nr:hypothetical protein KUTeg_019841 [Tegillarca granosa]